MFDTRNQTSGHLFILDEICSCKTCHPLVIRKLKQNSGMTHDVQDIRY